MSVTEKLMGDGRFDLRLNVTTTPTSVLNKLAGWSHIIVTPQPLSPDQFDDNTILSSARYTGVILRKETDGSTMTLVGKGLGVWLGDKDNRGRMINTPTRSFNNVSIATALDSNTVPYGILRDDAGNTGGLIKGTVTETGTNFTGRFIYTNAKTALEQICVVTDAEYKIKPNGEIDVGSASNLFTTTPTTVIVRNQGGDDPNITGVQISQLKSEFNAEDYVSEVRLLGEDAGFSVTEGLATQSSIPYKDLFGNELKRTALVSEANIPYNQKDVRATATLDEFNRTKQTIRLVTEIYDINGEYNTGDYVYVYDPDIDFVDETNEVEYRGQTIHPVSIRVLGITFPISAGAGVYHRDKDGNYTDLSGYVEYDTGEATIEVGESPRSLIDDLKYSGRLIQDKYADLGSVPDTPGSVAGTVSTYLNNEGITEGAIAVTWDEPNNTDGTVMTDGYQYRIRYKPTSSTGYQYVATEWNDTDVTIYGLITGTSYHIGVTAVDTKGYESTYSTNITVAIPPDTTAPSQPKQADTIATSPLRVLITHSLGKQGELNDYTLERDIERLNVYGSTTSGFTVNSDSKLGEIPVTYANIFSQIPVQGVISLDSTDVSYFRFTAVDRSGNESVPSTEQSASAELVDSQHIATAAIATAHIGDAQITTAKIGDAQVTNAKINSLSADKITAGTIDASVITVSNLSADNITGGTLSADRISAGSLDFNKLSADSISIVESMIANSAVSNAKIQNSAIDAAKIASNAVEAAKIAANAVVEAKIANNAVTDSKIQSVSFSKVTAFSVSANDITTGTMSADRISGGTITGTTVDAGTLTGTGSLDALNVGTGGLGVNGTVSLAGNTLTQVGQLNATRIDVSTHMDADGWTSGDDFRGNGGTVNLYRNFSSLGIRVVGAGSGAYLYGFNSSGGSYTIYTPYSDERLKENITDLGYGLNEINQLRPITYDWKDDVRPFPENTEVQYGLLAQELEEVMPELVDTAPNTHIVTDKEGNETEEELGIMVDGEFVQNTKSYAERPLIYILINAIQELTARVEALES